MRLPWPILLSAGLALSSAACGGEGAAGPTRLAIRPEKVSLKTGETQQLTAVPTPVSARFSTTWSSSAPDIAQVSPSGLVIGGTPGEATVTATAGNGVSATAAVTVTGIDPSAGPDIRSVLAAPLSQALVHSRGTQLYKKGNIMQGFDFTDASSYWYSQSPDGEYQYISFVPGPSQQYSSYMTLEQFGHMTQIVAEKGSDGKNYIWCNSNGQYSGSSYGDNLSFSRIEYKPGGSYSGGYAGDTFVLSRKYADSKPFIDLQVAIDFEARRLLVGARVSGVAKRFHFVYNLDDVLALPVKETTLSVTTSAGTVTRTFPARDLEEAPLLGSFEIARGTSPDQVYYCSHQGHEIHGDTVWFYEGNAQGASTAPDASVAYLTAYDFEGTVVVPRTRIAAIGDSVQMMNFGITWDGSAEAESLKIKDRKLYLGFAGHSAASSGNRIQSILIYDLP